MQIAKRDADPENSAGKPHAGSGEHDFTARDARKDFLSFLGHMVKTAQEAHDTVSESDARVQRGA